MVKEMKSESKAWGVASLVTSILALLLFLTPYIGLPLSIFSVVAASKQNKIKKIGIAAAGNVMGIIGIVINSIMLLLVLVAIVLIGSVGLEAFGV